MVNPKVVVRGGTRSPKSKGKSVLKDFESQPPVSQIVRVPHPPRQPELRRPLTEKQLDELQQRLPVAPENYTAPTMHIAIQRPEIKPDPNILHKLKLDKHQSEQSLKK